MKNFKKSYMVIILAILFVFDLIWWISTFAAGPTSVNLLSSSNFAILSKTAITDVPSSVINGDVWASPITGAAIGLTCPEVVWTIYSVDAAGPIPCRITNAWLLTNAVIDMEAAYSDAAGRALPTNTELNAWNIGWLIITPGLYKWSTDVNIATDVTLSGNADDVWIFQISGDLTIASAKKIILSGWANAWNIFWQVGWPTGATLGTTSTFNWTILSAKQIILQTNAILNWRALAQTQVTLDHNTINLPTANPTLHIIKKVVNTGGGTAIPSDFTMYVKNSWIDAWTPAVWTWTPGTYYSLVAGTYTVSEDANSSYTQSFSDDCDSSGIVVLSWTNDKTCTVTNTYVIKTVSGWGGGSILRVDNCPNWDYSISYYDWICWTKPVVSDTNTGTTVVPTPTTPTPTAPTAPTPTVVPTSISTPTIVPTVPTVVPVTPKILTSTPGFPNTGFQEKNNSWIISIIVSIIVLLSISVSVITKKHNI